MYRKFYDNKEVNFAFSCAFDAEINETNQRRNK